MVNLRPEEKYSNAKDFYTKKEANRYNSNSGMKNIQEKLTRIALKLSNTKNLKKKKILDIGCGTGFSLDLLNKEYKIKKENILGIDPSKNMLYFCKQKKYNTKNLGFGDLNKLIKDYKNKFDLIISISALNWIIANKKELQIKNLIKKIGKHLFLLLKKNGKCILQFYPGSKEKFNYVISALNRCDFKIQEYIYNKDSKKKRKFFLILYKT